MLNDDWLDVDVSFHFVACISRWFRSCCYGNWAAFSSGYNVCKKCQANQWIPSKCFRACGKLWAPCTVHYTLWMSGSIVFVFTAKKMIFRYLYFGNYLLPSIRRSPSWRLQISSVNDECGAAYVLLIFCVHTCCAPVPNRNVCSRVYVCIFNTVDAILYFIQCAHFVSFHFRFCERCYIGSVIHKPFIWSTDILITLCATDCGQTVWRLHWN